MCRAGRPRSRLVDVDDGGVRRPVPHQLGDGAKQDEDAEEVARKMGSWQIRRLPVLNRDKRLVGIVSLGDMVIGGSEDPAKEALKEISQG